MNKMIKYSFIVPVFNTGKYLNKCLNSLVSQSFSNFEIVIVNDGSTDKSMNIIKKYEKKYNNIKIINQKNMGLSVARNQGVKKAKGKYILFIDSDDYVEKKLLEKIDQNIDDLDVLRYQIVTEDENYNNQKKYIEKGFDSVTGKAAFKLLADYHFVEPAWCYVINKDYYIKNNFEFKKDVYHEDYGLIPLIIYKASKVKSIDYVGYHYIQRNGSIMNNNDYKKTEKKAFDMLEQYKILRLFSKNINKKNNFDDYYLSYISNSVIVKARELNKKERKKYLKQLKKINAFDGVIINTPIRKIKKALMKFNLDLYLKVVK